MRDTSEWRSSLTHFPETHYLTQRAFTQIKMFRN